MEDKKLLQDQIDGIQGMGNFMDDSTLRKQLMEAQAKLNEIIDYEVQGIIARSRAKWVEQGERSTKYFFGLEKHNAKKKTSPS